MDPKKFESIKTYVGFSDDSSRILAAFHPVAKPGIPGIVEDFYRTICAHPQARAALSGGASQVARLKQTLTQWLHSLLQGPHDAAYLAARARIGRVHVRIQLPQEFMFTAMNRIRVGLNTIAEQQLQGEAKLLTLTAVNQALDLELAIMLDTYQEAWVQRVRSNERLATVGQFAASIGHELRNPLGVIESSLFLLEQRTKKLQLEDSVILKHHQRIREQVEACEGTIRTLLDLLRENPLQPQVVALEELLQGSLRSLSLPEGLRLVRQLPLEQKLLVDAHQLRQVLSNLIQNALQALQGSGTITVGAEMTRDGGLELWVEDDGPGIPDSARSRIFEPLFTTREQGTGLGLALCKRIVERHGGDLQLVRGAGKGARFSLWLPPDAVV